MRDLGRRMNYHSRRLLMHLFFISPIDDFLKYLDDIRQRLPDNPMPARRINLMLVGSPVGFGDNLLDNILSEYPEVDIAVDLTCTGQRALDINIATKGDVIDSTASAYFQRPPCIWQRPNSQFYRYVNECYYKYKIGGIVYKTLKFCDLWKYEFKRFQEMIGHPMVQVENNYSPAQAGQFNKRVTAFIEMLCDSPI
jgi:benzoyl-CoA reductase/2-hydroxyglutaryl-CoA dehydratase subunit BcrC/BadD/HgdB